MTVVISVFTVNPKIRPRLRHSRSQKFGRGRARKYRGQPRPRPRGLAAAAPQLFKIIGETMKKRDKCNWASRMVTFRTQFSQFWSKKSQKSTRHTLEITGRARLQDLGCGRGFLNLKNSALTAQRPMSLASMGVGFQTNRNSHSAKNW